MTPEHFRAAILWIAKMSGEDKWNLTDQEVATLLGDIDLTSYQSMKFNAESHTSLSLDSDAYERLSLLLNIWRCLQLFAPERLAYNWFNMSNTVEFMGNKTIKEYLLESKDIEAFYQVKNYLCSKCC